MAHPKLALVDGHAVAFRAFHALRDANLRTSDGEPTFAVYGFCQIVLTTLQNLQPDYVAVSFDVGRTFRHDEFVEYKAGRAETPDEFHVQLDRIKQIVKALNIPIYVAPGFEADDVIGTLARQATAKEVDSYIITGDSDTLQLVDECVRVMLATPYGKTQETKLYDLEAVTERYKGLKPSQLADLRGLKGDVTDNIPGVKGIGETSAIQMLNQFGSVEGIYEHLEEVPNRYRSKLEGQQDAALFSKRLATIRTDVPVELNLEESRLHDYDHDAVVQLFRELQFGSLLKKLPGQPNGAQQEASAPAAPPKRAVTKGPAQQMGMFEVGDVETARTTALVTPSGPPPVAHGTYTAVTTPEQLDDLVQRLDAAPIVAFDAETNSLSFLDAEIVGISLSTEPGTAFYVPVGHREGDQLSRERVRDALRPFFEDGNRPKVAHNAKFDMLMLRRFEIEVKGLAFDTMIAAQLLGQQASGLKDLSFNLLGIQMTEITDLIGTGRSQITFDFVPIEQATPYAAADADMTLRLREHFQAELQNVPKIAHIFEAIEMPLVPVLVAMEWVGIKVDVPTLQSLSGLLASRIEAGEREIYALAGSNFNIGSGQQLSDVLFGKLQIPTSGLSKTKSGHYSITAEVLDKLSGVHPIIDLILEHRQLTKLKSTYLDALPLQADKNSRIHTSYGQLGAATGRLSSTAPNLQNIPVRTEQGREIRRAFVAEEGWRLLAADYSQVELRILAHVTQDPALLAIFKQDADIHTATASRLFNVAPDKVSKNQRRIAKMTVFGVIYGISSFGLAARTDLSREDAQKMIDGLFATYPGLRAYIDKTLAFGRENGYVETLMGRRRYVPELRSSHGGRRQAAEREAINAPIQGTNADLIKLAMVRLYAEIQRRGLQSRMLLQVHDELVLEVPEDEMTEITKVVCETMEGVGTDLTVPLRVEVESGRNWEEMK
jgi:DNA polymerase I